jgi:hypothetical protein
VKETQSPFYPRSYADVEIIGQSHADVEVTTGEDGEFRLYGVSGPTRLEVRKNGYVSQRHRIDVRAHQSADLGLPLAASRADISGVYTLTLRAADECAHFSDSNGMPQSLPEVARLRRYTAGITQDGPALRVQLSGATFATPAQSGGTGNSFGGRLEADRALSSSSPSEVTTGTFGTPTLSSASTTGHISWSTGPHRPHSVRR